MTEERNVNIVSLRGVIVFKYRKDNWVLTTIACTNEQGKRNYPKVYWYDNDAEEADKYEKGDRVEIEGKLQTSRQYKKPVVVGKCIKPTPKELEVKFGVTHNNGKYCDDKNEVKIRGEFVRAFTPDSVNGKLSIISIKTELDGRTYYPQITCFGRQLAKLKNIKPGDDVCVLAHIQTRKFEKDGVPDSYQTFVAHYLFDNDSEM